MHSVGCMPHLSMQLKRVVSEGRSTSRLITTRGAASGPTHTATSDGASIFSVLSVNVPAMPAPAHARRFYAKTWDENAGLVSQLEEQGAGMGVTTGFNFGFRLGLDPSG